MTSILFNQHQIFAYAGYYPFLRSTILKNTAIAIESTSSSTHPDLRKADPQMTQKVRIHQDFKIVHLERLHQSVNKWWRENEADFILPDPSKLTFKDIEDEDQNSDKKMA
ncbi:hypothetical protein BGZ96_001890 [Linnemannia gamsii]|uniref:Uncharacterized protein n=1 Tax=Linnemannia gamsii TaxID=64522 RepID=A0ABQ7JLJ4_9FUNG|nr:hypothetical protein BGZ96_001890 [Linnemannia gamsii]